VLASDIGRPRLTERYRTAPILGATLNGAHLPVFWFIEPSSGDVQFCDPRHAGVCVHIVLPVTTVVIHVAPDQAFDDWVVRGGEWEGSRPFRHTRDRRTGR
jgi:hypothetical protein